MARIRTSMIAAAASAAFVCSTPTGAGASELSTLLAGFAVLAGSTITNTGPTTIDGDIGVSPGNSITDVGEITLIPPSTTHVADPVAAQAQDDLTSAFTTLMGLGHPNENDLSGQDLGGQSLTAGVYYFGSDAALTGTLTLNAEGDPNAVFIIQVTSALDITANSHVVLINGAQGANVYWVVGSSATLHTGADFAGEILAYASITLNTGATITCGAALTQIAAVTMDTNTITSQCAFAGFGGGSTGGNAGTIAAVLDAYVAAGGVLPPALQALLAAGLTPEQLAAALGQLSGEVGTSVAPSATGGMDSFLSTLFDTAFQDDRPEAPGRGPSTVKALGYASETPSPSLAALAPLDPSLIPSGRWGVWAAGYGGYSVTHGDSTAGTHDQSGTTFGLSAGFDQHVGANSIVGVALGAGRTNFSVADGLGSGTDSMLQAALYARSNLGRAYVSGAVAYSYNDITTDRDINLLNTPETTDHFSAAFAGNDVAGQVEVGYRLKWLIPYAAARAQAFFTPAYSETATGTTGLGLSYAAQTTTALRTELGVRIAHTYPMPDRTSLTLTGRAAWAHDYGDAPYSTASFQFAPNQPFVVQGAAPARDSVLLSAGAEFGFGNGFAVAGLFDSAFSANSETYSGTGRISYRW